MDAIVLENLSQQSSPSPEYEGSYCEGEHENQISPEGEAGLHTHLTNCKKNPGHPEFIPIKSFSLEHLPEGYRDVDLYDLIKATADLTVRLSVTMTSPDRPEFLPNTKIPYFLSELRGKETLRTGTGRIRMIWKGTDEEKHWMFPSCPCDKCRASEQPSKVWWEIGLATAAHVVVDEIESRHTTLRFFYDSEDAEVVSLKVIMCVIDVNIGEDKCWFTCATCDENLGNKLEKLNGFFHDKWWKVLIKFRELRNIDRCMFIVSHPHGCSKQVSVGQWVDKERVGSWEFDHKYTYKTCTCPGSSGAAVYLVGYGGIMSTLPVHSGSFKSGLNYSGVGRIA